VILAAPCLRIIIRVLMHRPVLALYRWTPFRADTLALGVLAAVLWRESEFRSWLARNKSTLYVTFGLLLVGMVVLGIWFPKPDTVITQTIGFSWIALFYVSLLLVALTDSLGPVARVARIRWLGELGRISYCMYLIHAAVKYFCTNLIVHSPTQYTQLRSEAAILLALGITFAIAKLSWRIFESPLLKQGHHYTY
jgi:peptidoglycan/LPS O-acetylase OafA/YrhL